MAAMLGPGGDHPQQHIYFAADGPETYFGGTICGMTDLNFALG